MRRVVLISLFILKIVFGDKDDSRGDKRLEVIEELDTDIQARVEDISKLVNDITVKFSQISDVRAMSDTCSRGFDTVLHSLNQLHDKVSSLGDGKSGMDNLGYTMAEILAGNDSQVQENISKSYQDCVDYWHIDIQNDAARIYCLRVALWQYVPSTATESSRKRRNTPTGQDKLDEIYWDQNNPSQPYSGFRIRREYRTLTDAERTTFHTALNLLYYNRIVEQFAKTHACDMDSIHRGNAFLPWHRVFITFFEEALRNATGTVNTNMFLPYWDNTIDNNLEPGISADASELWGPDFLGKPESNEGPFRDWALSDGTKLRRELGQFSGGRLMTMNRIQRRLGNLRCYQYTRYRARLERMHDDVHVWVGGVMLTAFSPLDPLFYMHHAFIDKIWQDFREKCSNPTSYPVSGELGHDPDDRMSEMRYLNNKDGMAAYWADQSWYRYADSPSCPNCGSRDGRSGPLFCDRRLGVCKPYIRFQFNDTPATIRRTAALHESKLQKLHDAYGLRLLRESNNNRSNPCDVYPFMSRCKPTHSNGRNITTSITEIAKDMCAGIIPYSRSAGQIQAKLNREREMASRYPPIRGRKFFSELPLSPEDPYECARPTRAIVYDLLTQKERGVDLRWRNASKNINN